MSPIPFDTREIFPGDTFGNRWLAIGSIGIFYSGLAIYGEMALWSFPPLVWLALLFGSFISLAWIGGKTRIFLTRSVATWSAAYLIASIFSYVLLMGGSPEPLRKRFIAAAFIIVMYTLLAQGPRAVLAARVSIAFIVVISVGLSVYDITHPFAFVPAGSEFSNLGRAAGIYINANEAGMAILLGMIVSVGCLPKASRGLFVSLAIVGVVLTFSRGTMLALFVAVLLLWLYGEIGTGSVVAAMASVAGIGAIAYTMLLPIIESLHLDVETLARRALYFLDPAAGVDYSQIERQRVAMRAWDLLSSKPFVGHGVGTTELWGDIPTHNAYLMLGADFGLFGSLSYLLLAWMVCRRSAGPWLACSRAFFASMLIMALFNHGMLNTYALLIPIVLMAAMSAVADELGGQSRPAERGPVRGP